MSISESIKKKWLDKEYKDKVSQSNKLSHNTPEYKDKASSDAENRWKDEGYKNKIKESWTDEKREEMSRIVSDRARLKSSKTKNSFINKATKIHNNKYDYSKVVYINSKTKVEIICPEHGSFLQTPDLHVSGSGCKKCGIKRSGEKHKLSKNEFVDRANKVHDNKFDYSQTDYFGTKDKIIIVCPKHGQFEQIPNNHLSGDGCYKCATENSRLDVDVFIERSREIHNNKYDYSRVEYINHQTKVTIICPDHGEFEQTPNNHLSGKGCSCCAGTWTQIELNEYIKSLGFSTIFNNRSQIYPLELDIFIEEKKTAIEYHGLYWHSFDKQETTEEKLRHAHKLDLCEKKNIRLIQIFENEWTNKREIVESVLKSKLGISNRIYARKCKIGQLNSAQHMHFMNQNHMQGGKGCSVVYGLEYKDDLVSAMSFNKHPKYGWEITRFVSKLGYTVVGGASKLFKHFVKNHRPDNILTYADRRYSDGNLYKKLGFKIDGITKPNYFYVKNKKIHSRQQFQKHKLKKKLKIFDSNLTEAQNMFNNGYRRIWDAGHYRFLWSESEQK